MGDFDAFTLRGKPDAMLPNHIPGTDSRKSQRLARTGARLALAPVNGNLGEIAAQGGGNHLPHAQGGTGGGVDLMSVMRLDNLDIHFLTQDPGGDVEQFEAQVHADTHIGREDDTDVSARCRDGGPGCLIEARGAQHQGPARLLAQRQMVQGGSGRGEIDEHITGILADVQRRLNHHPQVSDPG